MKSIDSDKRVVPPGYQLVPPDGGYAWVMVGCAVFIGMITAIPLLAIGLLLPDIIAQTGTTAATASWVPALAFSLGLIIAPANVLFMAKYSHRTAAALGSAIMTLGLSLSFFGDSIEVLFLTYGVLFGIGYGIVTNSSTLILNHYFSRRYGQAIGYVIAGHALSRLIFSPLIELMIEKYEYQGVFLIIGGITANCIPASFIFHPADRHLKLKAIEKKAEPEKIANTEEKGVSSTLLENGGVEERKVDVSPKDPEVVDRSRNTCWRWLTTGPLKTLHFEQLKQPIFYIMFYSNLIMFTMAVYTSVFLPSLMLENGLTSMEAAVVQSARSGGEIAGRIAVPWLQAQFKINLTAFYVSTCAIQAILLIIIIFMTNSVGAIAVSAAIGVTGGGVVGLVIMLMVQSVGVAKLGATFSLIMFLNGFIALGFGPMIGFLRDVLGSFAVCFYFFGVAIAISCMLWVLKPWIIRQTQPQTNH